MGENNAIFHLGRQKYHPCCFWIGDEIFHSGEESEVTDGAFMDRPWELSLTRIDRCFEEAEERSWLSPLRPQA